MPENNRKPLITYVKEVTTYLTEQPKFRPLYADYVLWGYIKKIQDDHPDEWKFYRRTNDYHMKAVFQVSKCLGHRKAITLIRYLEDLLLNYTDTCNLFFFPIYNYQ